MIEKRRFDHSSAQGWSSRVWVLSDCFIILSLLSLLHLKDGCDSVSGHRWMYHQAAERADLCRMVTSKPPLDTLPSVHLSSVLSVRTGLCELWVPARVLSRVRVSLTPTRLLCPWDFPGKNTGVGCLFLLQGIFLTQGSNPSLLRLLHWQGDSLPLEELGYLSFFKAITLKEKKDYHDWVGMISVHPLWVTGWRNE